MGHDVGSYTLQRVYDQSVGAIDLTRVGLGGDEGGEDVPHLDLTLSPYLMTGGGRKYKPPTVRELVGQDPQLVAISGDIDAIERCLATNSTDWLSRPSFQEQQRLSHPDSCPDVLRLLKLTLRRRLEYWKDASQREFALTGKERDHLKVQAEIQARFQEGGRPSTLPAQLLERFNATTAAIEEDRREKLRSEIQMQAMGGVTVLDDLRDEEVDAHSGVTASSDRLRQRFG